MTRDKPWPMSSHADPGDLHCSLAGRAIYVCVERDTSQAEGVTLVCRPEKPIGSYMTVYSTVTDVSGCVTLWEHS